MQEKLKIRDSKMGGGNIHAHFTPTSIQEP